MSKLKFSGTPSVYQENGVMQTTKQKLSYFRNQYNTDRKEPKEGDFLVGFPWTYSPDNPGERLVTVNNLNRYADIDAVKNNSSHVKLDIVEKPRVFTRNKTMHFGSNQLMGSFESFPITYKYAQGVITHPFKFKHGRFTVKAKMPEGKSLWSAIWLISNSSPYAEIDIIEAFTGSCKYLKKNRVCTADTHYCGLGHVGLLHANYEVTYPNVYHGRSVNASMIHAFVDYECLWTPEGVLYYYNGKLVEAWKFKSGSKFDNLNHNTDGLSLIISTHPYSNSEDYYEKYKDDIGVSKEEFLGKTDDASGQNEHMDIYNFAYEEWEQGLSQYPGGGTTWDEFAVYMLENFLNESWVRESFKDYITHDLLDPNDFGDDPEKPR
jgi:hypothetical protein